MTRISRTTGFLPPTRSTSRSWRTRSSLACRASGISVISSSNSVPFCACSNLPACALWAPLKAPFSWPKSVASSRLSGIAAQLMATNGPLARAECGECSAPPLPCRPRSRQSAEPWHRSARPAWRARKEIATHRIDGDHTHRHHPALSGRAIAQYVFEQGLRLEGLEQKSQAPARIASTARSTSAKAVIRTTGSCGKRLRISLSRAMPSTGSMRTSLTTSDTACLESTCSASSPPAGRHHSSVLPVRGYRTPPRARRRRLQPPEIGNPCWSSLPPAILRASRSCCRFRRAAGSRTPTPHPGIELTLIVPPWARATPRAIARPRPVPCPRVVKKGSKTRACTSGEIPEPVSRTPMRSCRPAGGRRRGSPCRRQHRPARRSRADSPKPRPRPFGCQ
jgi:hypothetical protein